MTADDAKKITLAVIKENEEFEQEQRIEELENKELIPVSEEKVRQHLKLIYQDIKKQAEEGDSTVIINKHNLRYPKRVSKILTGQGFKVEYTEEQMTISWGE